MATIEGTTQKVMPQSTMPDLSGAYISITLFVLVAILLHWVYCNPGWF